MIRENEVLRDKVQRLEAQVEELSSNEKLLQEHDSYSTASQ